MSFQGLLLRHPQALKYNNKKILSDDGKSSLKFKSQRDSAGESLLQ